jgi:hypothetical protein
VEQHLEGMVEFFDTLLCLLFCLFSETTGFSSVRLYSTTIAITGGWRDHCWITNAIAPCRTQKGGSVIVARHGLVTRPLGEPAKMQYDRDRCTHLTCQIGDLAWAFRGKR